jgi:hypothetical protein
MNDDGLGDNVIAEFLSGRCLRRYKVEIVRDWDCYNDDDDDDDDGVPVTDGRDGYFSSMKRDLCDDDPCSE